MAKFFSLSAILVACLVGRAYSFSTSLDIPSENATARARFFALIKFNPTPCEVGTSIGACVTMSTCTNRGGRNLGMCARGFGVCCEMVSSCSAQTSFVTVRDHAVILESGMSSTSCTYEIVKVAGSCQIVVDFLEFALDPPDVSIDMSACMGDRLQITGSTTVSSITICGPNANQRIFLTYGRGERINLAFTTPNQNRYRLRVVHVPCNSPALVPSHCLQNFNTSTGVVKSFSYPMGMISGQSYTVCVQGSTPDSTLIEWSECLDSTMGATAGLRSQFFLSNYFLPVTATVDNILMGVTGKACDVTSHVEVYGEHKHCGAKFRIQTETGFIPVQSRAKPYLLHVNTVGNNYPAPVPTTMPISFPYPAAAVAPIPKPICTGLAGTGAAQGFMACTAADPNCSCTVLATGTLPMPGNPARSGFCLKYSIT